MTDLLLQDLENLTNEGLVQILSNEKKEMLGELRLSAKKRAVHRSRFNSFVGPVTKIRKARGEICYNLKS
jgi:hypothetical protein